MSVSIARRSVYLLSCNVLAGGQVQHYRQYVTRSLHAVLPGSHKHTNLDALAAWLAPFDIVGLQEADVGSLRSNFINQTRYLAEASGHPFWSHQPNRRMGLIAHSANGLLSRFDPREVLDYPLPGRISGRGALLVRYGPELAGLVVMIAHLSLGAVARSRQLAFIAEVLAEHPHAVLMGDLNTSPGSPELRQLFRRGHVQSPQHVLPTFPSWRPRRAIDHILVSRKLTLKRRWTLPPLFSDHLPLAAEIQLPLTAHSTWP